ncbi:MAG: tol-pal system-associated acyl-CoA thioesterase [Gammaproteobacteria bacterium]|nr:tol-pal system-associated acyl-CoA thioesterase [Gammaproteobacteria bacterium]
MTSSKEFIWPIRVYYEDTDSGGVVYYANYLKFMERARTEWLRYLGFEQDLLAKQEGIIFAVRRAEIEFIAPARFNDALEVRVGIAELKRASMIFRHEIINPSSGTALCSGIAQIACIDATKLRPRPIPESILKELPDAV